MQFGSCYLPYLYYLLPTVHSFACVWFYLSASLFYVTHCLGYCADYFCLPACAHTFAYMVHCFVHARRLLHAAAAPLCLRYATCVYTLRYRIPYYGSRFVLFRIPFLRLLPAPCSACHTYGLPLHAFAHATYWHTCTPVTFTVRSFNVTTLCSLHLFTHTHTTLPGLHLFSAALRHVLHYTCRSTCSTYTCGLYTATTHYLLLFCALYAFRLPDSFVHTFSGLICNTDYTAPAHLAHHLGYCYTTLHYLHTRLHSTGSLPHCIPLRPFPFYGSHPGSATPFYTSYLPTCRLPLHTVHGFYAILFYVHTQFLPVTPPAYYAVRTLYTL